MDPKASILFEEGRDLKLKGNDPKLNAKVLVQEERGNSFRQTNQELSGTRIWHK